MRMNQTTLAADVGAGSTRPQRDLTPAVERRVRDVRACGAVAVAMSGGVDSSVAAALLKEQGYELFGVTARMTVEHSRCCSNEDTLRAERVAHKLGIAHHVVDVCVPFAEHVIDYFMVEYLAGRTPSPCVVCNRTIKFGVLLDQARALGAAVLATGHYARIGRSDDKCCLERGVDRAKDQSYFLARLSEGQLARTLLPLGAMCKSDVVRYAADNGLATRDSRESQELCFVTHGTHGEYIDLRSFDTRGPGEIIDISGKTVGRHRGIHHYTVGQRKGLGIALGRPVYVSAIDPARNTITVADRDDVLRRDMIVSKPVWTTGTAPGPQFNSTCQIRYNHRAAACRVTVGQQGTLAVQFEKPQFAVTPGQLAVFYDGDRVLGGGWIEASKNHGLNADA